MYENCHYITQTRLIVLLKQYNQGYSISSKSIFWKKSGKIYYFIKIFYLKVDFKLWINQVKSKQKHLCKLFELYIRVCAYRLIKQKPCAVNSQDTLTFKLFFNKAFFLSSFFKIKLTQIN